MLQGNETITLSPTASGFDISSPPSDSPHSEISDVPSQAPMTIDSSATNASKCNMTNAERLAAIRLELTNVSLPEMIDYNRSFQYKTLEWITDYDELYLCPGDENLKQRYILSLVFFGASGGNWSSCDNNSTNTTCTAFPFLSPIHECEWTGVGCDSNNYITSIHLDERNISGSIPSEFRGLTHLVELDMDSNRLTGTIPSELGQLSRLEIIDLDKNFLTGTIPEGLYDATGLRVLDLDTNSLNGTVSTRIGQLTELYFLQLDFNLFSGSIPSELGNLGKTLKYISLFANKFEAESSIPDGLCNNSTEQSSGITLYADCDICGTSNCCTACFQPQ